MYDIGQNLQQAIAHKDLFLMTGRVDEVNAMRAAILKAHQTLAELIGKLEDTPA